jgi:UDP-N-acetylmuramoyl-tripeptide--D-alanyl-D-alanine ligase
MVILVGPERTRPIYEGLLAGGMEEGNVRVVRDIHEATAVLRHSTRPGDVVLFENDLPDTYAELERAESHRAEPERAESHQ